MASTYSSNLKIELIGTGEQTGVWGNTTNNNFSNVFEEAMVGRGNPDFPSDADLTLTYINSVASQTARNLYLDVTSSVSLSATRSLVVPTINKTYVVENNTTGGQSILVRTSAGTGITVPNGYKAALYVDTVNVVPASDYFIAPTFTTFTTLGDATFSGTGQVKIPAGTTANRSGSPVNGMIRYNTTTSQFEGYQGGAWGQLGGGATGGGGDEVFVENGVTVTTSYTLSTDKNAESVGPIFINSGATVTIPSGQRWFIL
jgi:hypothetical protein